MKVLFCVATRLKALFFFFFFSISCAASLLSLPGFLTRPRTARPCLLSAFLRDAEELLLAVWGGRRLCHHEGQNDKPVKRLRLCQIQRPQLRPDSAGDKAAQSGWKKCKCVHIKGALSLINRGICSLFVWAVSKPSFFISSFKKVWRLFGLQFFFPPAKYANISAHVLFCQADICLPDKSYPFEVKFADAGASLGFLWRSWQEMRQSAVSH